jgi:hypothetical protein
VNGNAIVVTVDRKVNVLSDSLGNQVA